MIRFLRPPIPVLLLVLLLAPAVLLGQEERKPGEFTEFGKQAYDKSKEGDIEGAIEILEKHREDPSVTAVDLALLGALYIETGRPADAFEVLNPMAEHPAADPALLYNAGRAADAIGKRQVAIGYFERSLAQLPVSPAARELGLIYGAQNRTEEAYRLLRPWAAQNPQDLEVRLAAIACALDLGRPSDAEPMFRGLPRENPKVVLLLGQYLSQVGDVEESIEVLETLLPDPPPEMEVDVYRLLAFTYINAGKAEKTVELLDGKVEKKPRLALELAEAYMRLGEHDKAIETLKPFAEILFQPDTPAGPLVARLALSYGRALASAGRYEDSLPYFELTTKIDPGQQIAWKGLGDSLARVGRREEAKAALEKFRDLSKGTAERRREVEVGVRDPVSRSILQAQEAIKKGKSQQALAILRQEIELSPQDVRPRILEVRILLTENRLEEALRAADNALRAFPDLADTHYQLGVVLMGLKEQEEAEKAFRRALEIDSDHTAAMSDLAVILMLKGERDEARKLLERVLEIRPDDKMAHENLERLKKKEAGG